MNPEGIEVCEVCGSIIDVDGTVMEGCGCIECLGVNEDDCDE